MFSFVEHSPRVGILTSRHCGFDGFAAESINRFFGTYRSQQSAAIFEVWIWPCLWAGVSGLHYMVTTHCKNFSRHFDDKSMANIFFTTMSSDASSELPDDNVVTHIIMLHSNFEPS